MWFVPTVHGFFEELGIVAEIFGECLVAADVLCKYSHYLKLKITQHCYWTRFFSKATLYSRLALLRPAVDIEPHFVYGNRMLHANFFVD